MRQAWSAIDLPEAIKGSSSTREAAQRLGVSLDSLVSRWRRLREQDPTVPALNQVVGPARQPRRVICDGDNHYPIHDPYYQAAKLAFARDWKPDAWVCLGDEWDVFSISSYPKGPGRLLGGTFTLQAEFDSSRERWASIVEVVSGEIILLQGNHENRLAKHIAAFPGFHGLKALNLAKAAELPGRVQVLPYGSVVQIGKLNFEHGDEVGGGRSCKNPVGTYLSSNRGTQSALFGHFHRPSADWRTVYTPQGPQLVMAMAQGHGMDVSKAGYISRPSWVQGFTAIEFAQDGTFTAHPIICHGGRFTFDGRVYDGRKCQ